MTRLSSPIQDIRARYDVVVVGSGYGGAVAASRLARAGQGVCLLERGREIQPGEYPDTPLEALREFQLDLPQRQLGSHTGLYDLRINDDVNVFLGCGLGGTSLVNAGVSLEADARVFQDPAWPAELRADLQGGVRQGYAHARDMLRPRLYPDTAPQLPKLEALEASAKTLDAPHRRLPLNVNFERWPNDCNHVGALQLPCVQCGDCVSGCNYSAKNTTLMNYLPDAHNHGAQIFVEVQVRRVARAPDGWRVYYQLLDVGREKFGGPELFVSADVVVLGAGALGTTEILLRSRAAGLELSDQLGRRFSGNGDVLGFAYNCDRVIHGVGHGPRSAAHRDPVGPCITGAIDLRDRPEVDAGMIVEEGAIPGALGAFLPALLSAAAHSMGRDSDPGIPDDLRERLREAESLVRGADHGAVQHTQTLLVMTHDGSDGRMLLEDDRLRIRWPGAGSRPIFQDVDAALLAATRAVGGTYVENPIWHSLLGHRLITVHPLGGCAMAEDAAGGVTNHRGQVFRGTSGSQIHPGLYVCDGALIPRSLGVNPLLTICAIAERNCRLLAGELGAQVDDSMPSAPRVPPPPPRPGIRFTETMKGFISTEETGNYERAARRGERDRSACEFTLTIASDDVERMLHDSAHEATALGTLSAPALSSEPLSVVRGIFRLNVEDPDDERVRKMFYWLTLCSAQGETFFFDGHKTLRDDVGIDLWADTTTLYATVYRGADRSGRLVARGILHIDPSDFFRQLCTLQVSGAQRPAERLRAVARFGQAFARSLFDVYGGVLAARSPFDPGAPPRKKRALRVAPPQLHMIAARDGVPLRLLRYRGGDKGPVLLSHGLGASSRIFATDTIDANLLEYLFAQHYDVWLLDYRASIELPSAAHPATADDVARLDYPAALAAVRAASGAPSVQVVAHCLGSTSLFMALLSGLEGVRSAVASQVATHIRAPLPARVKSGLHLPEVLRALGIESLTAQASSDPGWFERLYDRALSLQPLPREELCTSIACRRLSFMYAPLYEHDQLSAATHASLHELFGVAHTSQLEHLARMVREGQLCSASGENVYLPHLERLAIPICFIHGAQNACFAPESTATTYQLLRERHGAELYSRHVIPGYGHIDCIFGKNAVRDVYPLILEHLEES